jgi:DnaK suppressor protein
MDTKTARRFQQMLLDELGQRGQLLGKMRRSLTERGEKFLEEGGNFSSHMAELATEEAERESENYLIDAQRREVTEIEEALRRIEEGTFGVCESCGVEIARRRLEVLPSARHCIRCQERLERATRN